MKCVQHLRDEFNRCKYGALQAVKIIVIVMAIYLILHIFALVICCVVPTMPIRLLLGPDTRNRSVI